MKLRYPIRRRRLHWLAMVLASVSLAGATSACSTFTDSARDPRFATNTAADCVHGATGTAANIDCSRNHADRASNDIGYTTDTGYANGNVMARNNDPAELSPSAGRQYSPPTRYNY